MTPRGSASASCTRVASGPRDERLPGVRVPAHTERMDASPAATSSEHRAPDERVWRMRIALLVPKYAPASASGPPATLEFHSRIGESARKYGDVALAIRKSDDGHFAAMYGTDPQVEVVELVADVPARTEIASAVAKLAPVFGAVIDLLSFDMASAVGIGYMTVTDITPPASVGDKRAFASFSNPPFDLNPRTVEMQAVRGTLVGQLPSSIDIVDSQTAAALRWFVKSLSTTLLHDQFIFLWIALEIFCDASDIRVTEPYVARCGHEIANCPECGAETTKLVRGATLRAFLQSYGVSQDTSKALWNMRQLMHGAIPFDSNKLVNLGTLVQPLRAVVAANLKQKLGKGLTDPPVVTSSGLTIHPALGVEGEHTLTDEDIQSLDLVP